MLKQVAVLCVVAAVCSAGGNQEAKLYHHLLDNYENCCRPVDDYSETLAVEIGLYPLSYSYNPKKNEFAVTGFMSKQWDDDNLDWKPEEYGGISQIFVHEPSKLWTPDITLYSTTDADPDEVLGNDAAQADAMILSDGTVMQFEQVVFKTVNCSQKADSVSCNIAIGSWMYDGNQLDLKLTGDGVDDSWLIDNPFYDIESFNAKYEVRYYDMVPGVPYPVINYDVRFKKEQKNGKPKKEDL